MAEEETGTAPDNADEVAEAITPETEQTSEDTSTEDTAGEAVEKQEETAEVVEKPKADLKQRKIAKQARELREMKRQNAQLARAVEEQSKAVSSSQKKDVMPKIEDFDSMDEYLDARDDFRDSKREAKKETKTESTPASDSFDEMVLHGADKYEDFEDIITTSDSKISPTMADSVLEIDDPDIQADVAYFLSTNPKESARIAKLSERRQAAEIGKLEIKVQAKPAAKKQVSKAPPPIKPVGGTKTANNNEIKDSMSPDDFIKVRNKQLGRS